MSLWGLCTLIVINSGCNRSHYRKKADKEVYCLVKTVAHDPRWELNDYTINVDKEARFYDPYNPDCEPMPTDDPTAHRLMGRVDGMKGSKAWKKYGRTNYVENPLWKRYLSVDETGAIVLDKETAVRLALKHSSNYQTALEELYKSALRVSTQRYEFDTKFFGGASLFYDVDGTPQTTLEEENRFGFTRNFATGADILIEIANTLTWTFHGRDSSNATSLINMSFTQPLLRGAGRAVVLENLTQAERDLLADVRQMAYFQQGFYVATVTGSSTASGPGRVGAGIQSGYYTLLSEQVQIKNQMRNISSLEDTLHRTTQLYIAGRSSAKKVQVTDTRISLLDSQNRLLDQRRGYDQLVEGFILSLGLPPDQKVRVHDPLLEQFELMSPSLTKQQENINALLAVLRDENQPVFEEIRLRIPDFSQQLLKETEVIEKDLQHLEKMIPERIDNLKILADRPAVQNGEVLEDVCRISDFETRLTELRAALPEQKKRIELIIQLNESFANMSKETLLEHIHQESFDAPTLEMLYGLNLLDLVPILATEIQERIEKAFRPQLDPLVYQRRLIQMELNRIDGILPTLERSASENSLLREAHDELQQKRTRLQQDMEQTLVQIKAIEAVKDEEVLKRIHAWVNGDRELVNDRTFEQMREERLLDRGASGLMRTPDPYRNWLNRIAYRVSMELNDLLILQARIRLDSIVLTPIETTAEEAFETAAENRLDWMNQRAALVDTWRQIEIEANELKSYLSVHVDGSIGTVNKNMVDFRSDTGALTVGLRWDSPLDRLTEQNDYRTALINYQQARRNYYTYVDDIKLSLRNAVREIYTMQLGFEIQREGVLNAILNVDLAMLNLENPEESNINATRDVLDNLNNLLNAQNSFMTTWVNYLERRMQFELMMGTLRLDGNGMWIDSGESDLQKRQSQDNSHENETLNTPAPTPAPVPMQDSSTPTLYPTPALTQDAPPNPSPVPVYPPPMDSMQMMPATTQTPNLTQAVPVTPIPALPLTSMPTQAPAPFPYQNPSQPLSYGNHDVPMNREAF